MMKNSSYYIWTANQEKDRDPTAESTMPCAVGRTGRGHASKAGKWRSGGNFVSCLEMDGKYIEDDVYSLGES
jgi:hypothetical protein